MRERTMSAPTVLQVLDDIREWKAWRAKTQRELGELLASKDASPETIERRRVLWRRINNANRTVAAMERYLRERHRSGVGGQGDRWSV